MYGQRFDCGHGIVRLTKIRSKFLVCLNGRPQKVDMSRLVQNSLRVYWNASIQCCSQTVAPRRHVFFERPLRQTRNPSDVSLLDGRYRVHCRNLNEHKSSKESYRHFMQILDSGYGVRCPGRALWEGAGAASGSQSWPGHHHIRKI